MLGYKWELYPRLIYQLCIDRAAKCKLTIRERVLIKASGRVSGTIRHGQIEIECGGQISGDIQAQPASEPSEIVPDVMSVHAAR